MTSRVNNNSGDLCRVRSNSRQLATETDISLWTQITAAIWTRGRADSMRRQTPGRINPAKKV